MIRTGTPVTSHHLLEGVLKPRKEFGCFVRAHEKPSIKLKTSEQPQPQSSDHAGNNSVRS